jgi:cytochrome bd-type quinol oxidase subunit 2
MNKEIKLYLAIMFLFLVSAYFGDYLIINSHEQVHKVVYENSNITSKITINYFLLTGVTEVSREDYEKCDNQCKLAHDMNEVFGYQMVAMVNNLWLAVFLLVSVYSLIKFTEWRNKKEWE